MNYKFRIGKTVHLIILSVFLAGIFLGIVRSDLILTIVPGSSQLKNSGQMSYERLPVDVLNEIQAEEYLLIYNDGSRESVLLKDNIEQTLLYMKKKVEVIPHTLVPEQIDQYKNVIIALEEISKIPTLDQLMEYTSNGGKIFFAMRPEIDNSLYNVYRKLGIYEVGDFITLEGIKLTSNILINQRELTIGAENIAKNSSLAVGLESKADVLATSDDDTPLMWSMSFNNGKFIVFNGTMLSTKENRGLISGALSMLNDDFIYPILDMKVLYLDDFPAPIQTGYHEGIFDEYRRDIKSFFEDIWWPDILSGAAKYDVVYTGVLIETYNDVVKAPFNDIGSDRSTLIRYGRELLKMGGELGVHGYNHQSLTTDPAAVEDLGYNAWNSMGDMVLALQTVESFVKQSFPNYPLTTYVPPSNRISDEGVQALLESIPTINTISSLYLEDDVGYSKIQEFDATSTHNNLPRITSGYEYSEKNKWAIANAITSIGVFSHFIHPDDIFDENRSFSKSWSTLSKEYNGMLSDLHADYPWLQSRTASNASIQMANYLNAEVFIKQDSDRIIAYVDRFAQEMKFLLRTNKKIGSLKNCTVTKVDDDIYVVSANDMIIEIGLVD
ncbi:DUF2194 domain-containing protein [Cytobacillus sp. Hm23]